MSSVIPWPSDGWSGRFLRPGKPATRLDGCWDGCTGSPAGMMTIGGILRREVERGRDPCRRICVCSGRSITTDIRSKRSGKRSIGPSVPRRKTIESGSALADLATRTGRLDEAAEYLARCERARPDDPAVWQARLEWGRAAGRADDVMRAARHLPASAVPRSQVLALRAWIAASAATRVPSVRRWSRSLRWSPPIPPRSSRLAALAAHDGQNERAARIAAVARPRSTPQPNVIAP